MAELPKPPQDISPRDFFETFLPDAIENAPQEIQDDARQRAGDLSAIVGFRIPDAEAQYSLHIAGGDMSVQSGLDDANVTLVMNEDAWREMLVQRTGNPTQLFMTGRLRIEGDMSLAMRLQSILAPAIGG